MRPCFAAIRQGNVKVSDQMMYDQLRDLRADGATDKLKTVMRDAVEILNNAVTGGPVEQVTVSEEPTVVAEEDLFDGFSCTVACYKAVPYRLSS